MKGKRIMVVSESKIVPPPNNTEPPQYKKAAPLGFFIGISLLSAIYAPISAAQTTPPEEPAPVAPSATRPGPFATTASEYRFPATVDPDIIGDRETEIWAVVHRPTQLPNRPNPLIIFLHGNHETCGTGSKPRIDNSAKYSFDGTCPPGYVVVPNHRGYDYLAKYLAAWGYVVVSINANRGISAREGTSNDQSLVMTRGKLILKHLQLLSIWNATGGTPSSLGVDLRGKLSFDNVGLMGHSRGGEAARAAYNLYRDPGSPWVSKIPNRTTFKGIFEIAPVDGQSDRVLNADGVAWNVLLPQCDADVDTLEGVKPFDRMMQIFNESNPTPKSTYTVWGANHNYYNTEWQVSEDGAEYCLNHEPIFEPGRTVGSAPQRVTSLVSLTAFVRGNIPGSAGYNPIFNRNFNPQFALPPEIARITRVDRGYTSASSSRVMQALEDFEKATGTSSRGFRNLASKISIDHINLFQHDLSLVVGSIYWSEAGDDVYFQTNSAQPGTGINISGYKTLDLRLENQRFSAAATDFEVALVQANGALSQPVSIKRYLSLKGPGGGPGGIHLTLQTARIPLTDFGVNLTNIQGVRLIFNKTEKGGVYVANIRLSANSDLDNGGYSLPEEPPLILRRATVTPKPRIMADKSNKILSIRRVVSTSTSGLGIRTSPAVEIEVTSSKAFPVRDRLQVLRIGDREFVRARYPRTGETNRLIFTLTESEFNQIPSGEEAVVQYGRGNNSLLRWKFGRIDKNMLR